MNIVITAGGTKEAIDQVRHITNMSSGELGRQIFYKAYHSFDKIYFLSPKSSFPVIDGIKGMLEPDVDYVETNSVDDLYNNLQKILTTEKIDVVIHSMAVSDFTVDSVFTMESLAEYLANELSEMDDTSSYPDILNLLKNINAYKIDNSSKISSKSDHMGIALRPTQKVISNIKKWAPDTVLVGFKLLNDVSDEELIRVAREQMKKNKCDFVWANDIKRIRENGGHQGVLVERNTVTTFKGKENIAKGLIDSIIHYIKE